MEIIKDVSPKMEFSQLKLGDCFLYLDMLAIKISPIEVHYGNLAESYNAFIFNRENKDISLLRLNEGCTYRKVECTLKVKSENEE